MFDTGQLNLLGDESFKRHPVSGLFGDSQFSADVENPVRNCHRSQRNDAIFGFVQHFVDRVSFASGYAASLLGDTEGLVTLDPLRAMGRWSVRAVPTEVLAEGFRAGESIESLASLYELQIDEVTAALRFELQQTQPRSA